MTEYTRSRHLVILATIITAILSISTFPSGASGAGSVILKPCAAGAANGYGAFLGGLGDWVLDARCSSQVTISSKDGVSPFWSSVWTFPATPRGTIGKVAMDLSGGDGSADGRFQYVKACTPKLDICGPPTTATAALHHELTLANGGIPAGADRLYLAAGCSDTSAVACRAGTPLQMSNLEITLLDTEKPMVQFSPTSSGSSTPPVAPDDWNGGDHEFRVRASDPGTGIRYLQYQLRHSNELGEITGGANWNEGSFGCGAGSSLTLTIPYLCPTNVDHSHTFPFGTGLEVFGVSAGRNRVAVVAYDAAGNASEPLGFDVYLDYTLPEFGNLRTIPERSTDWQPDTSVGLAWDYFGDPNPSDTESGLDRAKYTVYSEEPGVDYAYSNSVDANDGTIRDLALPEPGRWRVHLVITDRAGNTSEAHDVYIRVDPTVPDAPRIEPIPTVSAEDLASGRAVSWTRPANEAEIRSGICGFAQKIDRSPDSDPGDAPGISGSASHSTLPDYIADGRYYLHLRAISCAGVRGAIDHQPFTVDTAAPALELSEPLASGWYSPSHPLRVTLKGGAAGDELSVTTTGEPDSWSAADETTATLREGEQTVLAKSRDEFGNLATVVRAVKFDGTPPSAIFTPATASQPTLIGADITDAASGLISGAMQYRPLRPDTTRWETFANIAQIPEPQRRRIELAARFPDVGLPDGPYELRVVATDAAGNTLAGGTHQDASTPLVALPLRGRSNISASVRKPRVDYGATPLLRGRLTDAGGEVIAHADVEVLSRAIGSSEKQIGLRRTDGNGRFAIRVPAGPSRLFTVKFSGSETAAPESSTAKLIVEPRITLRADRKRFARRWRVSFKGSIGTLGASVPKSGIPVTLEFLAGGEWHALPDVVAGAGGRFRMTRSFAAGGQPVRYRFRARVGVPDGWPYAAGSSRVLTMVLR